MKAFWLPQACTWPGLGGDRVGPVLCRTSCSDPEAATDTVPAARAGLSLAASPGRGLLSSA